MLYLRFPSQADELFSLTVNIKVSSFASMRAAVTYTYPMYCSYSSWASREIVCEENYMEVKVLPLQAKPHPSSLQAQQPPQPPIRHRLGCIGCSCGCLSIKHLLATGIYMQWKFREVYRCCKLDPIRKSAVMQPDLFMAIISCYRVLQHKQGCYSSIWNIKTWKPLHHATQRTPLVS